MINNHPMQFIKDEYRPKVLIILLIGALLIFSLFYFLDIPLNTLASPLGVVSFELSGSLEKSEQIMSSWNFHARLYAAFGLGFDFLFMVVYASAISLACLMISKKHSGWFSLLGVWLGWGVFLAAISDSIENISLWNLLTGNISSVWPVLAAWCAIIKFAIILLGIIYSLAGWLIPRKPIVLPY
jgi:hypothetical protein